MYVRHRKPWSSCEGLHMVEIGGRVCLAKIFPGLPEGVFSTRPKTHARYSISENLVYIGEFYRGRLDEDVAFSSVDSTINDRECEVYCALNGCRRK